MPILREPTRGAPLTQGDILKGLPLFATAERWEETGQEHVLVKAPLCMVLSRPCAANHKPQIVVASIERVTGNVPKDVNTFAKVRQYLEQLRDGLDSPDRFYLGQRIPNFGEEGRYFARLDSLHTVKLPARRNEVSRQFDVLQDELAKLVDAHRIAALDLDFCRDLHKRIFSAFASLGFDDYGWYPDQDLNWVVATGSKELGTVEADVREKQAVIAKNTAAGESAKNEGLKNEVETLRTKAEDLRQQLAKYERERANRSIPPEME